MKILSEIETTSKVALTLTSRINLGRSGAGAHQAVGLRHSLQASTQSEKGYPQVEKDPYFPQGLL